MAKIHVLDLQFLGEEQTIAAFLIETSAGPLLIETGPHSTFAQLQRQLSIHGYQVADIKHVLLTHIHLDHAGAAWAFAKAGAQVYVHPTGYAHLADPSKLMDSARRIYQDQMDTLWGDMQAIPADQLRTVENGETLQIGDTKIIAHHTPGHAIHHIAWQIEDTLFTGDVAGVCIVGDVVVPPCPPPDIHIEDWLQSIALMRAIAPKRLLLTHYGQVTQVSHHLDQLTGILLAWRDWIKPYYDAATPAEEIVPAFQDYVANYLISKGIDKKGLVQYEYANPSWMSVAGLLRYWKKHNPSA